MPSAGNPQSLNRYSYAVGNPLKYIDPSGHRYCVDVDENGRCIAWENPRTGEIERVGGEGEQEDEALEVEQGPETNTAFKPQSLPDVVVVLPMSQGVDCNQLRNAIADRRNELVKRAFDILLNPRSLPMYGPSGTVESHQVQFRDKQVNMRRLLNQWATSGCAGELPDDAWKWATIPIPFPEKEPSRQFWMDGPQLFPAPETIPGVYPGLPGAYPHTAPVPVEEGVAWLFLLGLFAIAVDVATGPSGEGLVVFAALTAAQ